MKIFATLICLLFATTGFAQQRPSKQTIDSLSNIDNMPIHKGHGNAINIPTRKGQGNAIDIPTHKGQGNTIDIHNRTTPIVSADGEHSAMVLPNLKGPTEWFLLDSSNRLKPNNVLPFKKN
jgi:hypothetical protein